MEQASFDLDGRRSLERLPAEERSQEARRRELMLDRALEETFPASDPVASGRFD